MEIAVDQNVCLRRIISDGQWKRSVAHTGLRSLWTISIECRYRNPLAASASFGSVSVSNGWGKSGDWAY